MLFKLDNMKMLRNKLKFLGFCLLSPISFQEVGHSSSQNSHMICARVMTRLHHYSKPCELLRRN